MPTELLANTWTDGVLPSKAIEKAYKQNPKAVTDWSNTEYPDIAKRSKKEGAEIHRCDKIGFCNNSYHGRSYTPRGETAAINLHPSFQLVNLISSITNQWKVRFIVYDLSNDEHVHLAAYQGRWQKYLFDHR